MTQNVAITEGIAAGGVVEAVVTMCKPLASHTHNVTFFPGANNVRTI